MTHGMREIIALVDEEAVMPTDVCDFILTDPDWLLSGISMAKLNELRKALNEADETKVGVWLR